MSDTEKLLALEALLSDVIFALEMTQYSIEDSHEAHNVVQKADEYQEQMLNILHS